MKILLINSLYYPNISGGTEISVQILAEELQKRGIKIITATLSDKNYIDFVNGIKVYYFYHSNFTWLLNSKRNIKILRPLRHLMSLKNPVIDRKLEKIIKSENPDIVFTHNLIGLSYSFWTVVKKNRIPLIHALNDYYLLCWKSTLYSKNKNFAPPYVIYAGFYQFPRGFYQKISMPLSE